MCEPASVSAGPGPGPATLAGARLEALRARLAELAQGPWCQEDFTDLARQIEAIFTGDSNVSLDSYIKECDHQQAIFDSYIETLHMKLTPQEWKKYPTLVEVYCSFLKKIDLYQNQILIDPVKVMPTTLLLIDDFEPAFKLKGLESCQAVLRVLDTKDFKSSNYQQVIYEALNKLIREKDLAILKNAYDCMEILLPLFPVNIRLDRKWNIFDDFFKNLLEDIYLETSGERKCVCFDFVSKFIDFRQIDCARGKKRFNLVICENLDLYTGENSGRPLLRSTLMALRTWLRNCWAVWFYKDDEKLISLLFKLLYIECKNRNLQESYDEIKQLIICMISLCTKKQRNMIKVTLQSGVAKFDNELYQETLHHIVQVFQ